MLAVEELYRLRRQFLKHVHPDIVPPRYAKEKEANCAFVRDLNDYMDELSVKLRGSHNTSCPRVFFVVRNGLLYRRGYTFIHCAPTEEKIHSLAGLFSSVITLSATKKVVPSPPGNLALRKRRVEGTMGSFESVLRDYYNKGALP